MAKTAKSPDSSGVSEKRKYVRRSPRKAETKSPDSSGVSAPEKKVIRIKSNCPNTLIDPNNGRAFYAFSMIEDVVMTNWVEVQIAAGLLKEV